MQVSDKGSNAPAPTQGLDTKKAAVIAKLAATMNPKPEPTPPQAQETPVLNPSNVSVEEMSAITGTPESGQETTSEPSAAAPEESKPAAKEEPLSAQYAQLARKEKAMRIEAQRLKAERDAIKAEREALNKPAAPSIDESKYVSREKLRENALAILAEEGISYSSLTEQAINAPSQEQIEYRHMVSQLKAEIAQLKGEVSGTQKNIQEQQENSYKQALNQIRNDVNSLVRTGDTYEMVRATQSVGDVVELIERTFKEGLDDDRPKGTLLSVEEAAQIVEDHLLEEGLKLSKLNKIQQKLKPAAATPASPAKVADAQDPKKSQLKTLTNSISSTRQYTAKERAMFAAEHGPNWRSKVS